MKRLFLFSFFCLGSQLCSASNAFKSYRYYENKTPRITVTVPVTYIDGTTGAISTGTIPVTYIGGTIGAVPATGTVYTTATAPVTYIDGTTGAVSTGTVPVTYIDSTTGAVSVTVTGTVPATYIDSTTGAVSVTGTVPVTYRDSTTGAVSTETGGTTRRLRTTQVTKFPNTLPGYPQTTTDYKANSASIVAMNPFILGINFYPLLFMIKVSGRTFW